MKLIELLQVVINKKRIQQIIINFKYFHWDFTCNHWFTLLDIEEMNKLVIKLNEVDEMFKKQNNKLIQDFMGWKLECEKSDFFEDGIWDFKRYDEKGNCIETDIGGDSWHWDKGDTMQYDSSWNLLMLVINKIYNFDETDLIDYDEFNDDYISDIRMSFDDIDIKNTYETVVNAINYYNEKRI